MNALGLLTRILAAEDTRNPGNYTVRPTVKSIVRWTSMIGLGQVPAKYGLPNGSLAAYRLTVFDVYVPPLLALMVTYVLPTA